MIKDSGERRSFETGAVRDIQTGKGRPSLMPLDVVAVLVDDNIPNFLEKFKSSMDTEYLYEVLRIFSDGDIPSMLLDVSIHYEEGAAKYGDNNWQKGIPVNCYLDSAIRHYLKHKRGDDDEPHDRAFVWNILCCIWEVDYHHD
jgi:hypothetical protein